MMLLYLNSGHDGSSGVYAGGRMGVDEPGPLLSTSLPSENPSVLCFSIPLF